MIKRISCMLAAALLMAPAALRAVEPVGNVITYQGQLKQGGVPVSGTVDLEFKVWDAPENGTTVGLTVSFRGLAIENGLFTVPLDFGPDVFTGEERWLAVGVRPSGNTEPHSLLSPRQLLTAAPYALYALGAGNGLWAAIGDDIYNINSGDVGVGTASPDFDLEVYRSGPPGTPPTTLGLHWVQPGLPQSFHEWFYFAVGGSVPTVGSGTRLIRESGTELHFQTKDEISSGLPATQVVIDADGQVGIGTMNPAVPLHVTGGSDVEPEGGGIFAVGELHAGNVAMDTNEIMARNNMQPTTLYLNNDGGTVRVNDYGWPAPSLVVRGSGSARDNAPLQVHNDEPATGMAAQLKNNSDYATMHIENESTGQTIWLQKGASEGDFIVAYSEPVGGAVFRVAGDGRTIVPILQITGGADLAEPFHVSTPDGKPEPGMVVCIDADKPGQLVPCHKAYDRTVAGVISGAGGVNPGMIMAQTDTIATGEHPVALTGRVWCHCVAAGGAIQPGDLLTTAAEPGHAMKVTDHQRAQGAVLGKAMTALEKSEGLVLVLVNLQ